MFRQKSVGEQANDTLKNSVQNVTSALSSVKENINNTVNDFSSQTSVNANKDFLTSNTILAKVCFIIIVLIGFFVIFRVCIVILQFFFSPSRNPYVVYGSLEGNERKIIPQDPAKDDSAVILRSNNQQGGAEFTWSVWLFLRAPNQIPDTDDDNLRNIFVKGSNKYDINTGANVVNGPGLYLRPVSGDLGTEYDLVVIMDHIGNSDGSDTATVKSLPIGKWFHVAIRLENMMLDTYINGTIAIRTPLEHAPKQNFYDVIINGNKGFNGKISNLRYYSSALNIFELNNIVMWGPNTNTSYVSTDTRARGGNYTYLSSLWYSNKY